jgi:folate-binding protein YgfZ
MSPTPLHDHLAARGAVHFDDRGVLLPRDFGDAAGEYRALRDGATVVDLGFRTLVDAIGPDAVSFLQGMLTNDVARLAPGQGCPALLLTIQGRVTADLRVAALADRLRLDVDRRVEQDFRTALDALIIADDVELVAPEPALALLGLEGPAAAALVDAADLAPYAHAERTVGGVAVHVVRGGELDGASCTVHVAAPDAARVWDALVAAGARPAGMAALEGRRVELGVPRIGLDMGAKTLSLEVPVGAAVSMTKGCYLGQEVVARGTARGQVNRRLCALRLAGPLPAPGTALVRDGKEVGLLTTVAHAFGIDAPAALGFVRREWWEPGTEIGEPHGNAMAMATVVAVPLA